MVFFFITANYHRPIDETEKMSGMKLEEIIGRDMTWDLGIERSGVLVMIEIEKEVEIGRETGNGEMNVETIAEMTAGSITEMATDPGCVIEIGTGIGIETGVEILTETDHLTGAENHVCS